MNAVICCLSARRAVGHGSFLFLVSIIFIVYGLASTFEEFKVKRSLLALSAAALLVLPSAGLGNVQASHVRAATTITVWEDFPNEALPEMQTLANKWAAKSGDSVKFVSTSQPGMGSGSQSVTGLLQLKAKWSFS
jgi:hypothetical protein